MGHILWWTLVRLLHLIVDAFKHIQHVLFINCSWDSDCSFFAYSWDPVCILLNLSFSSFIRITPPNPKRFLRCSTKNKGFKSHPNKCPLKLLWTIKSNSHSQEWELLHHVLFIKYTNHHFIFCVVVVIAVGWECWRFKTPCSFQTNLGELFENIPFLQQIISFQDINGPYTSCVT